MSNSTLEPSCHVCLDLTPRDYDLNGCEDCQTVSAFQASSEQGCWGCKIMVDLFHAQDIGHDVQYSMRLFHQNAFLCNDLYAAIWDTKKEPKYIWTATLVFSILCFPDSSFPLPNIKANYPISGDTGSNKAVARAVAWLGTCAKEHRDCPGEDPNTQLPTRVLKIDGPQHVKLHVSVPRQVAPYLCLSHCWGKSPMIRTTLSNMKRHQAGIVWNEFPKTFQHAIDFTHRLGFKYLWIDSLCIIQDSVSDWRQESARMAGVYQGSSLTLCATLSSDSSGGCYAKAEPKYLSRSLILTDSDSKSFGIHTRQPLEHTASNWLPLLGRGWALQERLLSPRTLDFTANELIWECPEISVCECSAFTRLHRHGIRAEPHRWMKESVEQVFLSWNSILRLYSRTSLSLPKDIFPALQGLAKKAPPTMGQYLAGLWRETLVAGLNWSTVDPEKRLRPEKWRAPTWSWASVMGPLNTELYDRANVRILPSMAVIEAKTTPKGTDPTGELSSGELFIRGRGVKMHVIIHRNWSDRLVSLEDASGAPSLSLLQGNNTLKPPYGAFRARWDYAIAAPGPDHVPDGSEVMVVKLSEESSTLKPVNPVQSCWLILQSSKNDPEAFERIGILVTDADESEHFSLQIGKAYRESPEVEMRII